MALLEVFVERHRLLAAVSGAHVGHINDDLVGTLAGGVVHFERLDFALVRLNGGEFIDYGPWHPKARNILHHRLFEEAEDVIPTYVNSTQQLEKFSPGTNLASLKGSIITEEATGSILFYLQ